MLGGSHSHGGGSGGSHSHGEGGGSVDLVGIVLAFAAVSGLVGAEWIGHHVYQALYPGVQIARIPGGGSVTVTWGWCLALLGFALVCAALGILLCSVAAVRRGGGWLAWGLIAIAMAAVLGLLVAPYLASQAKRADAADQSTSAAAASSGVSRLAPAEWVNQDSTAPLR